MYFCYSAAFHRKTVAAITNYTDRQVRNVRDRFENGDFPREGKKRGRKKKIRFEKKRIFGRIVKTIERELEEYDLSDLYKLAREKEKKTVHVNYAGGWLLAPFIYGEEDGAGIW